MRFVAVLKDGIRNALDSLHTELEQMRRHVELAPRAPLQKRGEALYFVVLVRVFAGATRAARSRRAWIAAATRTECRQEKSDVGQNVSPAALGSVLSLVEK